MINNLHTSTDILKKMQLKSLLKEAAVLYYYSHSKVSPV